MNQQDLGTIAKAIIDANMYMVLGTADETGQPWTTPVYFSHLGYREFYWISSPDVRHSHNLAIRAQTSLVIFDSQIPVGKGQAVYMSAIAEKLTGMDFDRGLEIYNDRFSNPEEHGVKILQVEDLQMPALYRLYRAIASEHWVLDPAGRPDHRTLVTI